MKLIELSFAQELFSWGKRGKKEKNIRDITDFKRAAFVVIYNLLRFQFCFILLELEKNLQAKKQRKQNKLKSI